MSEPKVLRLAEVKLHSSIHSCWIVIKNKVYDCTKFLQEHPGGEDVVIELGGCDATQAFVDVGHSKDAWELLTEYYVGDVHPDEQVKTIEDENCANIAEEWFEDYTSSSEDLLKIDGSVTIHHGNIATEQNKKCHMDYGGYDASFVDDPPEIFKCIVCHMVLRDPVMFVECSHQVCSSCFEYMKRHAGQGGVLCPHDRLKVDASKVVENKGAARTILDFKVKCNNSSIGCDWMGELRHLERHTEDSCRHNEQQRMSKQLKELLRRVEACEGDLAKKDVEIKNLTVRLDQKDAEILNLKHRLDGKDTEIDSLTRRLDAKDTDIAVLMQKADEAKEDQVVTTQPCVSDFVPDFVPVEVELDFDKLRCSDASSEVCSESSRELELRKKALFNRRMNVDVYVPGQYTVFIWSLPQYSQHRNAFYSGERIYSNKFYSRPRGHCCVISISWFGEKLGRVGVYIHTCRGFLDTGEDAAGLFDMAVTLEASNMVNGHMPSVHMNKAEILENRYCFEIKHGDDISLGYGNDYFLNSPVLLNDELIIKCTLWEQQELGWVSDGHVQQLVIG